MPSFSATDREAKCVNPVAERASHPSAAAATGSNCAANSDTRREASADDDGCSRKTQVFAVLLG
jgi:hypothetical protein